MNDMEKNTNRFLSKKISRKEALKKTGITALTAATLFFLETKSAAATSPSTPLDTDSSAQSLGGTRDATRRPDRAP